eukprot:COSAG04_NODE_824_length_10051_cov_4.830687_1_plen_229_part_10
MPSALRRPLLLLALAGRAAAQQPAPCASESDLATLVILAANCEDPTAIACTVPQAGLSANCTACWAGGGPLAPCLPTGTHCTVDDAAVMLAQAGCDEDSEEGGCDASLGALSANCFACAMREQEDAGRCFTGGTLGCEPADLARLLEAHACLGAAASTTNATARELEEEACGEAALARLTSGCASCVTLASDEEEHEAIASVRSAMHACGEGEPAAAAMAQLGAELCAA